MLADQQHTYMDVSNAAVTTAKQHTLNVGRIARWACLQERLCKPRAVRLALVLLRKRQLVLLFLLSLAFLHSCCDYRQNMPQLFHVALSFPDVCSMSKATVLQRLMTQMSPGPQNLT